MKISFLFWNIGGKDLRLKIAKLVRHCRIDVLVLVECPISPDEIAQQINQETGEERFGLPESLSRRILVFARLAEFKVTDAYNDGSTGRLTIRRVERINFPELLLAAVHFFDRRNMDPQGQNMLVGPRVAQPIRSVEEQSLHQRTILLGDFNMNPYDGGMIGIEALHGVMAKQVAERSERTFHGKTFPFFYNPMWSLFGDRTTGPPGTFYYDQDASITPYWHMLDQVLLRPPLMQHLCDLAILTSAGGESLLTDSGRPSLANGSDHLPLYFQLEW